MLNMIDKQLDDYDSRVGSSLQQITADQQGRISIRDLRHALSVIKHKPDAETVDGIVKKLDPDHDGYVLLEHVLDLAREEGLGEYLPASLFRLSGSQPSSGILVDDDAKDILGQGKELKGLKPKKEDIVQE